MSQLSLDIEQIDADVDAEVARIRKGRNTKILDAQMRSKDVARIQRAIVLLLDSHPDKVVLEGGIRRVDLTIREAAAWCRANCECVRGLRCDHSGFHKALQVWVQRGVMAVSTHSIWMNTQNLRDWFDSIEQPVAIPEFKSVHSVSTSCPPAVHSVSTPCPPQSTDCPPQSTLSTCVESLNEGMNESSSIISSEPQAQEPKSQLASLPAMPAELWGLKRAVDREEFVYHWWKGHGLGPKLGIHAEKTRDALLGLIEIARTKPRPAAYFAKACRNPAPYLADEGQQWLKKVRIEAARGEPVPA
jgi:hypothetical protein